ncbi:outer membrane beta-barrel protein [Tellurirhabdus rosea]|uniref:outer membrane beta-barrel protein n=1 Tax=Tellurirhabdus rosea TaxID=2674997 RepID=UPI002258CBF6|nr:outer membrane beta-barrel protein [Tellurirhabdus rosea]
MHPFLRNLFTTAGLLTGFLTTALTPVQAQSGKNFQMGLKVGANFSQLNTLEFSTPRLTADGLPVMSGGSIVYDFFQKNDSRTTGIVGGIYARFGRKLYLQPEILFSAKGGKFNLVRQGLETQSVNVRFSTIDIPLLLGLRLGPLRLNAGPMASLRVTESGSLKETLRTYTSQSFRQTVDKALWGYQAGIGLTISGMQLDLRHESDLNGLAGIITKSPANDGSAFNRTGLWQLTVGFGL